MAGILVMAIGLSILWPPGIILVFLAAGGFLWAVFAVAQPAAERRRLASSSRAPETPAEVSPAKPRPGPTPDTRTVPGTPRGRLRPPPRSP